MYSTLEKFKDSYFQHPSREGPNFRVLDELDENEREEAESLLLESLNPDKIYSIQALGYLRSQRAFDLLLKMVPQAEGVAKVHIAAALWNIKQYRPALSMLCQILTTNSESSTSRRKSAQALREIKDKSSIEALRIALEDEDYLVQYHAQRSLAILLELENELETLEQKMNGSFPERQKAAEELKKLLEKALDNYDREGQKLV